MKIPLVVVFLGASLPAFSDAYSYSVKYKLRFQSLRGPGCQDSPPVLRVRCSGKGMVEVTGTSSQTIVCGNIQRDSSDVSFMECTNICQTSANTRCEDVWLNNGTGMPVVEGPFGQIDFECSGPQLKDIKAFATYVDSGNGNCSSIVEDDGAARWNYRIAQLGVRCDREYSFSHRLSQCQRGSDSFRSPLDESLTCLSGRRDCSSDTCVVDFEQVSIESRLNKIVVNGCYEVDGDSQVDPQGQDMPSESPIKHLPLGNSSEAMAAPLVAAILGTLVAIFLLVALILFFVWKRRVENAKADSVRNNVETDSEDDKSPEPAVVMELSTAYYAAKQDECSSVLYEQPSKLERQPQAMTIVPEENKNAEWKPKVLKKEDQCASVLYGTEEGL